MNSQVDFLKKRLESLTGTPFNSESRVAEELLREFPEEDTENVKAYRAAETLLDYFETNDLDDEYDQQSIPLNEQLLRISNQIREDAREDVVDRLEIDKTKAPFDAYVGDTVMTDPVSKMQFHISGMNRNPEGMANYYAREILEAPL